MSQSLLEQRRRLGGIRLRGHRLQDLAQNVLKQNAGVMNSAFGSHETPARQNGTSEGNNMHSHTLLNIFRAIARVGAHGWNGDLHANRFAGYLANFNTLDKARKLFYSHDESSCAIFDWRIQHLVTKDFYKFPFPYELENAPFSDAVWKELEKQARSMTSGFAKNDYLLDRIDTWILESYTLPGICEVKPGDIVLDCGAYTGNTSLYFSQKTGPDGHVYGFEADRDIFSQYIENIGHVKNCTPIPCAVSKENGIASFGGGAGSASLGRPGEEVATVALDDFILKHNIPRVDFIKIDVEGAEADVLLGAAKLIKRFRPKMAVSIYHKAYDVYDLPSIVRKIDPNYNFRLRHYSNKDWETIAFCTPDAKPLPLIDYKINDNEYIVALQGILNFIIFVNDIKLNFAFQERNVIMREHYALLQQYAEAGRSMEETVDRIADLTRQNAQLSAENIVLKRIAERYALQNTVAA